MNTTVPAEALGASAPLSFDPAVKPLYLDVVRRVERLHRRLLDIVKDEFDRHGPADVNSIQALLLYNIGDQELSAGELRSRGCYLGSNVSYNVKKLVEIGYLHYARSSFDRRSVRIRLTDRGREVQGTVQALYDRHARSIDVVGGLARPDLGHLNDLLARLERFWSDQASFRM